MTHCPSPDSRSPTCHRTVTVRHGPVTCHLVTCVPPVYGAGHWGSQFESRLRLQQQQQRRGRGRRELQSGVGGWSCGEERNSAGRNSRAEGRAGLQRPICRLPPVCAATPALSAAGQWTAQRADGAESAVRLGSAGGRHLRRFRRPVRA